MKKILKKGLIFVLVLALGSFALLGCSSTSSESSDAESTDAADTTESNGTINMVHVNWAEGVAMTNLAAVILEEKMGYEVEMTMADVAPIFTSLADGDADVFMDAWLPTTHASYMEEYGDDIETLGVNFEDAKIGLVVPSYMDIDTIEELNDVADDIDGEIIGIDSGAGIMSTTETAIETYGLDIELVSGSEAAMIASLDEAYENEEPIVITGWTPHWMFATYDLKFLEDSEGVYGDSENIYTLARDGFSTDEPEVAAFFTNFSMTSDELGDLMGKIADSEDDPYDVAKAWMEENEDLVSSWLSSEAE